MTLGTVLEKANVVITGTAMILAIVQEIPIVVAIVMVMVITAIMYEQKP